ncbi:MAG TPA: addiction module antitoxin RelB [Desulfobulbaceae bacterium]|nr:MAG: addiction module antitoxin RelB [Deltaproteobacteria bacterium RIFOXYD12_FULL_53_23]HCC54141.1 addiction module antitoxin RelB [Desulfobulbaceae bacterium]
MATTVEKIMDEAMGLPPTLRAFVAEKLIESLDVRDYPLSATWQVEIRRRCAEIDNSTARLRDADTVFKNAYASLA